MRTTNEVGIINNNLRKRGQEAGREMMRENSRSWKEEVNSYDYMYYINVIRFQRIKITRNT